MAKAKQALERTPSLQSFDPATGVLVGKKIGKTQLVVRVPGGGGQPITVTWNVSVSDVYHIDAIRFPNASGVWSARTSVVLAAHV